MKVLMITGEYPPMGGGISGYTHLLVQELRTQGTACVVLSHERSAANVTVAAWTWKLARQVREIVATEQADVVHIQYQAGAFDMHPAVNLLPRLLPGAPTVTTFHDLRPPYLFPKAGGLRNAAIKRMARWSGNVVVTNPADRRTLNSAGIDTCLIPLGSSLPTPEAPVSLRNSVGFFGYPSEQKGFHLLVQAIAQVPAEPRPEIRIVGSKPPAAGSHGFYDETAVEALAKRHNVQITWTGYLDAQIASNALAACGVIAFPFPGGASLRSSAMIAALQTGRPVVTTHPAGAGDLLDLHSLPTLKLATADVPAIAQTIESAMQEASRPIALPEPFQWSTIAANHRVLYETATGKLTS